MRQRSTVRGGGGACRTAWLAALAATAAVWLAGCAGTAPPLRTGLETLAADGFSALRDRKVGVVTNATGVDRDLRSLPALLVAAGVDVRAIFSPEHGLLGAAAAGEAVGDGRDPETGIPVHSLYGKTRRPTPEMLAGIDLLLFDIQDIGVRAYTYLSTLVEVMRAAAAARIEVWVLDRPVPLGGEIIEGPVLEPGRESFVGAHRVPLRHGLTAGEFARLVLAEAGIDVALRVVPVLGYERGRPFEATGIPWVPPSPNIPTLETALVYAGMVLVEGTNLSEGRGTALPFQLVGAPWLDGLALARELNGLRLPGCRFRPASFTPAASKHQGLPCQGVQVHVLDARAFRPVTAAVALLSSVRKLHPAELKLQAETFDRLAGTTSLREAIERGAPVEAIVAGWAGGHEEFLRRRESIRLYP